MTPPKDQVTELHEAVFDKWWNEYSKTLKLCHEDGLYGSIRWEILQSFAWTGWRYALELAAPLPSLAASSEISEGLEVLVRGKITRIEGGAMQIRLYGLGFPIMTVVSAELDHFGKNVLVAQGSVSLVEKLEAVLREHWLFAVTCNEETHTDTTSCACAKFHCEPQPNVGEAVERWIEHVAEVLAGPACG